MTTAGCVVPVVIPKLDLVAPTDSSYPATFDMKLDNRLAGWLGWAERVEVRGNSDLTPPFSFSPDSR